MNKLKLTFLLSLLITITGFGCSKTSEYKLITNQNGYKEFEVAEELMGPINFELSPLHEKYQLLSTKSKPIEFEKAVEIFSDPLREDGQPNDFQKDKNLVYKYAFNYDIYELKKHPVENKFSTTTQEQYQIIKEKKTIFSSEMCYGASGPIEDMKKIESNLTFTFMGRCNYNNTSVAPKRNIYYQGKTTNEQYNLEESKYLFSYNNKIGYVGKKDGVWKIFYDNKPVSNGYDDIITKCCCAAPCLFEIYENGALVFLAQKDGKNLIVEIDLNKNSDIQ